MTLQLGVVHCDGRQVQVEDLSRLLGPWARQLAETSGELLAGPLAMAYRGDRITEEDDGDIQPLRRGPYVLTWDGRLDNRAALARRLELSPTTKLPDAALVLEAYGRFGDAVLCDLLGEFALALYSAATRLLCLARSTCGARPLYYTASPQRLLWASDFAHLVRVAGVDLALDEAYVLGYLVFQPNPALTPLRDVHAVPPNRALWFQDGRLAHTTELWDPTRVGPLTYRSDDEYEERCRELVTEAVRVRLRAKGPVFAELSGGFDSSTIVLTADRIRRDRNESPEGLRTLSCVYERSKTCDERAFIRAVEDQRGVATHLVHERDQRITLGLDDEPPLTGLPNPIHCFPGRYPTFGAVMREQGARVLLSGRGGDHLFLSHPDGTSVVADALWAGELGPAHMACRRWSRASGVPYHRLLLAQALPALLAARWPAVWPYIRVVPPAWLARPHRARVRELVRHGSAWSAGRTSPSRQARLFLLEVLCRATSAGHFEEYAPLYVSHPYTHRPLLEFYLGVPITQLLRAGEARSLMRRAFRDRLPLQTQRRVSKGLLDEALLRAVGREWAQLGEVRRWQVCERGFVEPKALIQALQQMRRGFLIGSQQIQGDSLGGVFSFERWLRALTRVGSCARAVALGPRW